MAENTQVRYIHVCILSSEARRQNESNMSIPARGKRQPGTRLPGRPRPAPARPSAPGRPAGNCWTPPSAFSRRTALKRPAWKTSRPAPDTREALSTPISKARKISSLPCSRSGCGSESNPSPSALRRHSDPAEKLVALRTPLRRARHGPPPGPDLHGIQAVCPASPRGACPAARAGTAASAPRSASCFPKSWARSGKTHSDRLPGGLRLPRSALARIAAGTLAGPQDAVGRRRPPGSGPFFRFDFFELRPGGLAAGRCDNYERMNL